MTDQLELSDDTQDEISADLQQAAESAAEVDVESPGFSSLLTLLLEAQAGQPDLPSLPNPAIINRCPASSRSNPCSPGFRSPTG